MYVVKDLLDINTRNHSSRLSTSTDSSGHVSRHSSRSVLGKSFRRRSSGSAAPARETHAAVYPCPAKEVRSCCMSHTGELTLTAYDSKVGIWNTLSGARRDFMQHTKTVAQVAVSADGSLGASASIDGSVRVFDTRRLNQLAELRQRGFKWAQGAALSADGQILFASFVSDSSEIGCIVRYRWNRERYPSERPVKLWTGHARAYDVFCSDDGARLLYTRSGGRVQLMDVASGQIRCSFEYIVGNFHAALDGSGKHVVIADNNLAVHTVHAAGDGHTHVVVPGYRRVARPQCGITGNGWYAVEMTRRGVAVRNALNGELVLTLENKEKLKLCRISADGSRIVAVTPSGTLVVWTPDTLVRAPLSSTSGTIRELLDSNQSDFPTPDGSASCTSPWFVNSRPDGAPIPDMALPPTSASPRSPRHVEEPFFAHQSIPPPPDPETAIQYDAPSLPPPLSAPPPFSPEPPYAPLPEPDLPPIEALLRATLEANGEAYLTKSVMFKVIRRQNVTSLEALFAGHNILLIALRSGVLEKGELSSFMGEPYFFFSELYLPYYAMFNEESARGQLLVKKIFLHAEHLGFMRAGEAILAVAAAAAEGREEIRRIDMVVQQLCKRVGALEVTAAESARMLHDLHTQDEVQLQYIATLAKNLTIMHETIKKRDRGLMYANLAKCLLSLLPLVGSAVGNAAFSATEVLLQMSAEDMWSAGTDVSHCIIDQVANVDMSNIQVLRYVLSAKGLSAAGPAAEANIKKAIEDSSFDDVAALNGALQREITLVSKESRQLHMLSLADKRWASSEEFGRSYSGQSAGAGGESSTAAEAAAAYDNHVGVGELMSYDHAKIHIGSYLQLKGFRPTIDEDTYYELLYTKTNHAPRVSKRAFVASCEHFVELLAAEAGRVPAAWTTKFQYSAAPQTDMSVFQAANVLLDIWKSTEDKSQSVFSEEPERKELRASLREFGKNRDGHIDKDEFIRAARYVMYGLR